MICEIADECASASSCDHSEEHRVVDACPYECNGSKCVEVLSPDDIQTPAIQEAWDYLRISETLTGEERARVLKLAYDLIGKEIDQHADTSLKGDDHGFTTQGEDEIPSGVHGHEESGA